MTNFPHWAAFIFTVGLNLPAHGEGMDSWKTAPFKPSLIHVAGDSQPLCSAFEYQIRENFLANLYSPPGDSIPARKPDSRNWNQLNEIEGFETAYYYFHALIGNLDNEGPEDRIFVHRISTDKKGRWDTIHKLYRLTSENIPLYRIPRSTPENRYDIHQRHQWFAEQIAPKKTPEPRDHPSSPPAAAIAEQAYDLPGSPSVLAYLGRIYLHVTIPAQPYNNAVLLSYDQDLQPKAECIVRTDGMPEELSRALLKDGPIASILKAAEHTTGARDACMYGTSKPFYHLQKHRRRVMKLALFKPALITEAVGYEGKWQDSSYEYYWSLRDPFNRRAYNRFQSLSLTAAGQLADHYTQFFGADQKTAHIWAGHYISYLRNSSSRSGDYYHDIKGISETVERIRNGFGKADDFIQLALTEEDRNGYPLMREREGEPVQAVLDMALTLAVGADANPEIINTLIERGASASGGDHPALMNAIDHPPLLAFILKREGKPDRRNGFGKTALMAAAHMNNLPSVRLLLGAGADPNLKTYRRLPNLRDWQGNREQDCRYKNITFRERTSLMYAAENASPDLIKTLLNAGASPKAVDSKGRTVLDYLAMNETVSAAETLQILQWFRQTE